jgi:DNA-binding NarL/FixJ family response regulator
MVVKITNFDNYNMNQQGRMKTAVIFVVDKNPIHRSLIKYNLNISKFTTVYTFSSAEECLYRMQKNLRPDFLITSFFTGNYSGFDFLRIILEIDPVTRVVFFDAFEDPDIPARLIEAGACDYVAKTRDPDAGIAELLKNVSFLAREKALIGRV